MSGDSTAILELGNKIAAMQADLVKLGEKNAALLTENQELKGMRTKFTALEEQVQRDKVSTHRKAITDKLEAAVKTDDIQPKTRANFISVYGVEDDDQVLKVTLEQVEDFVKANPNPFKKRDTKKVVSLTRASDDVPAGTPADQEVSLRVDARLRETGKEQPTADDIQRAVISLFRANPDLGERYRDSVNVAIKHPSTTRQ